MKPKTFLASVLLPVVFTCAGCSNPETAVLDELVGTWSVTIDKLSSGGRSISLSTLQVERVEDHRIQFDLFLDVVVSQFGVPTRYESLVTLRYSSEERALVFSAQSENAIAFESISLVKEAEGLYSGSVESRVSDTKFLETVRLLKNEDQKWVWEYVVRRGEELDELNYFCQIVFEELKEETDEA